MSKTVDGIVLRDFIELLLGRATSVSCPDYIACKLNALDPTEQLVHVERPNAENELKNTHVWRAEEWRTAHAKWVRTKELSARERQVNVLASELRAKAVRKFIALTGLDEANATVSAAAIIKSRNKEVCEKLFGIRLDELEKADFAYKEYKLKIGVK